MHLQEIVIRYSYRCPSGMLQ